jgi:hypothetical protein
MLLGKLSACKKLKLDLCLSPCTRTDSKCINDLNIRPETLKLVQERAGDKLELISIGNDFLTRTQMAQQLRERIDKWDYMKLKSVCTTKEIIPNLNRLPTEWEKIFTSYTPDKRLIARIYRELKKTNLQKNQ